VVAGWPHEGIVRRGESDISLLLDRTPRLSSHGILSRCFNRKKRLGESLVSASCLRSMPRAASSTWSQVSCSPISCQPLATSSHHRCAPGEPQYLGTLGR
jgi:hypothetical protein